MSLGQQIYDMVANMMFTAKIDSPRFDDYQIYALENDPGIAKQIDNELAKLSPKREKQQDWHTKSYEAYLKAEQGISKKSEFQRLLGNDLGSSRAANVMGMLRSPQQFIFKIINSSPLAMVPAILAILALPVVIEKLNVLLFSKGGPVDRTFRYTTANLDNVFRERAQQYSIEAGFTQVITTTNAGTTDPRDSYNSFETESHNIADFQNIRQIGQVGNIN